MFIKQVLRPSQSFCLTQIWWSSEHLQPQCRMVLTTVPMFIRMQGFIIERNKVSSRYKMKCNISLHKIMHTVGNMWDSIKYVTKWLLLDILVWKYDLL